MNIMLFYGNTFFYMYTPDDSYRFEGMRIKFYRLFWIRLFLAILKTCICRVKGCQKFIVQYFTFFYIFFLILQCTLNRFLKNCLTTFCINLICKCIWLFVLFARLILFLFFSWFCYVVVNTHIKLNTVNICFASDWWHTLLSKVIHWPKYIFR